MRSSRVIRSCAPLALGLAAWASLPSLEWCPISWDALRVMCAAQVACAPMGADDASACGAASEPMCGPGSAACARGCTAAALPMCDPTPDESPLGDHAWCIHPPIDGITGREIELRVPRAELPSFLAAEPDAPQPPITAGVEWQDLARAALSCSEAHAPPPARAPPRT